MSDKNLSWSLTTAPEIYTIGNTGTRSVVATEYGWTKVLSLAGTASSSGTTVTGTSTTFTADLRVGSKIVVGNQVRTVATIASNTSLTTTAAFSPALSGATLLKFEEVLVALSELLAKKVDVLAVPTFTLTLPVDGNYVTDDVIELVLTASEGVSVVGSPYIVVTLDSGAVNAVYSAADSTETDLVFKYTVTADDAEGTGIAVASSVTLGSTGRVKDKILASGGEQNVAAGDLTFTVGDTAGILVND